MLGQTCAFQLPTYLNDDRLIRCDKCTQGAKFGEVIAMTDIFEGSIIRTMRRLEELLRELVSAAKTMGSTDLENKFAVTITHIKRDIVFAASLYL